MFVFGAWPQGHVPFFGIVLLVNVWLSSLCTMDLSAPF